MRLSSFRTDTVVSHVGPGRNVHPQPPSCKNLMPSDSFVSFSDAVVVVVVSDAVVVAVIVSGFVVIDSMMMDGLFYKLIVNLMDWLLLCI